MAAQNIMFKYLVFLLTVSAGSARADTPETIVLHYYERPPFALRVSDGSAEGLLAEPARRVFETAHIPYRWVNTPAKRQLGLIQANVGPHCGLGWYKNAERAGFAQFTKPIYRDHGVVAIASAKFMPLANAPLNTILADPSRHILIKSGLTYGAYVNGLIEHASAHIEYTTLEQPQMVRMIAHMRADMMFSTTEEAAMLTTQNEKGQDAVHVVAFPDAPQGEARYIMCSKKVPLAVMRQLNAAIDALNLKF